MNGMILGTYIERLNLFQICEMLVVDYSDWHLSCMLIVDAW
jgi:hypothetical protein